MGWRECERKPELSGIHVEMNAEGAEVLRQGTQRETEIQGLAKRRTKPFFIPFLIAFRCVPFLHLRELCARL